MRFPADVTPPEQIARLLAEQGAALALYASQWTGSPDDCVQEALIELAGQAPPPELPLAWLYRVVKRRALNASRSDGRRRAREREAFRRRFGDAAASETDALELIELVDRLDGPSREAVVLRLWGGLSFAEIGETIDVSTATAQRRYTSAIEHLRVAWRDATKETQDHEARPPV